MPFDDFQFLKAIVPVEHHSLTLRIDQDADATGAN
jgi:hypothetical protein